MRDLTLERVAERVELSPQQVNRIELGQSPYTERTLHAFSHAFDCEPEDLLRPPITAERREWLRKLEAMQADDAAAIYAMIDALSRKKRAI